MGTTSLKWGLYNSGLAFSTSLGSTNSIRIVGVQLPVKRSMSGMGVEVFPEDDGMNIQRESLLRYRVAVSVAETMGERGQAMARGYEARAERIEREMEGAKDNLVTADRQATGRGCRVEDL